MPLVGLSELLTPAKKHKYAVAAFDVVNAEYAAAIVEAAERKSSPVILMILEGYLRYFNMKLLVHSLREIAGQTRVPVAVHLDHATTWETVVCAVKSGCTSVMLDCSSCAYEENVARTREVVELCRPLSINVESELGHVGGDESIGRAVLTDGSEADERCFTDPQEAERFVRETGVDALAISVGNIHGPYKGAPKLDLERIQRIAQATGVPLVLHGGSGLSDRDFQDAIQRGVCKVNVNTSLILAAGKSLKAQFEANPDSLNFPELLLSSYRAVSEEAARLMDVFDCAAKA